jgi:hypothetical protein
VAAAESPGYAKKERTDVKAICTADSAAGYGKLQKEKNALFLKIAMIEESRFQSQNFQIGGEKTDGSDLPTVHNGH